MTNFTISFDNNVFDTGSQVGFSLADSSNVVRFRFYFVGGESTYRITDATTGRTTSIPHTSAGLTVSFTQTSSTTYSVTIGPTTVTGTLAGSNPISRVVFENNNAGSNADHNFYFGEMSITDVP